MDVGFCHALSARLFKDGGGAVDFIEIEPASDGFFLLSHGDIDVLTVATWTFTK